MDANSKQTILSSGQARLHAWVLVLSGFMLANGAYLFASPPEASILPSAYQWLLVLHVVVGVVLIVPLAWFVIWHLPRARAMRNGAATSSGLLVTLATTALLVTGFFIFTRANSAGNRWAFVTHQVLSVAAPLIYLGHRMLGRNRPTVRQLSVWFATVTLGFAGMVVAHQATKPPLPPDPQAFVPRPPEGVDVYKDDFPTYGVSGAPVDSAFFPAATRTITGRLLPNRLLTNADLPDERRFKDEIRTRGFAVDSKVGAETCARCHADIVEQWSRSAHRFASFNNPFYRVAVESLRKEDDGRKRSQWCAGCHDPAIMMAGNMTADIHPETAESQAGLTCLACHAMDEVHGVGGNGSYRIADATPEPYLFADARSGPLLEVHDLLIRSKPDVHKRDMLKPVFRTSEYCGTCHKVSLDVPVNRYRWIRGQNEYDAHQDSGVTRNNARTFYLAPTAKRCQDCHMPLVDAPLGDLAAKSGKVRSHQFPGPNTALPSVRHDSRTLEEIAAFRKDTLRVDIFAVKFLDRPGEPVELAPDAAPLSIRPGETIEVQVVVRNKGAGHGFPGGTTDSNQAWVHFKATFPDGTTHVESGSVDASTQRIDETSHFYRTVFVDEDSREIQKREPHRFRAVVHQKLIGPGTADVVRYRVTAPAAPTNLKFEASVRWRKFSPDYAAYAWNSLFPGRDVPVLPIDDLARAACEVRVAAGETARPSPDEALTREWVRINDWGIGLLLQGDTIGASAAFRRVAELRKELPDGPRNLARAALQEGNVQAALASLEEAERRAPGNAQTAYFFGVGREKAGQLDEAIAAFERARQDFPGDRTIHSELGQIRFRLGRYDDALRDILRVLAIDPEDRAAHYSRMQIYQAMGDKDAAGHAERAYLKYQIDESAQKWTRTYREANEAVNLESQLVHGHSLRSLR